MPLLLAFLALLLPQAPKTRETTIHGLVIPIPADWKRNDDQGVAYLIPPQNPSPLNYLLAVFPSNKLQGAGHWTAHKEMAKALLQQAQWKGEPVLVHKVEGPGFFIKTEAAGNDAAGQRKTFTLFTALHDGTMEAVLGVNQIDRNVVDPVLAATRFKDPPKSEARPKIVEAYRRTDQKITVIPAGGTLMYERLWLREDGVADFSSFYFEGYAASPLVLKVDSTLMNGDYGSWKADGNKIQITRSAGAAPVVYERDNGGLRGDGKTWDAMPRVDGLKLSGRYAVDSDWIEFTPEGKFKTEGVLKSVATGDVNPTRPPARASGTYEMRDWTMFFKFDDGTAWSTDFSTVGRDQTPDSSILFRTSVYPKAK